MPERDHQQLGLGPALRRAWLGYRRRLDEELADSGFADHGFPDGRVLRLCSDPSGRTIAQLGRELGVTRQGAGKIVASLRDRRYVTITASATNGREKAVKTTKRGSDFLTAQRRAARAIERQLRAELGSEPFASLDRLLESLGGGQEMPMSDYLRRRTHPGFRRYLVE